MTFEDESGGKRKCTICFELEKFDAISDDKKDKNDVIQRWKATFMAHIKKHGLMQ